jgi:hypothetical protein
MSERRVPQTPSPLAGELLGVVAFAESPRGNGVQVGAKSTNFGRQSLLVFFQFPFSTPGDWFENGEGEQRWRHVDAKQLGGSPVDDQLELGRLLDRQVGRLGALEDAQSAGARCVLRYQSRNSSNSFGESIA